MDLSMLGLTKAQTQALEKLLNFMTYSQKDVLFDELDKHLHDETYKDMDDEVDSLRGRLEQLGETIDFYNEVHTEWMEGQKVAYSR